MFNTIIVAVDGSECSKKCGQGRLPNRRIQ